MSAPNTTRWIGIGQLGLPLYGALTFWSSLDPQPDPNTHYEAWARYVTTNHYVLTHVLGSILGLILAIFGTFALGAYLTRSRSGRLGLVAMVITVLGNTLFLPGMGVSAFAVPEEGQAYLTGIEGLRDLPSSFADVAFAMTSLLFIVPAAPVLMYLSLVYAQTIGPASTLPTVLVGALLIVISGAWMALSVLRRPAAVMTGVHAQPSVQ
jgi:hypothetical protein